jgi:hypothetical protein
MIVVNIMGGLGNQLFQYAFGRALAIKNNCQLKLDISSYNNDPLRDYNLRAFSICENLANVHECNLLKGGNLSFFQKLMKEITSRNTYYVEKNFRYNHELTKITNPAYILGYWQSEKYFKEIEDIIRNEFTIVTPPSKQNRELINKIINENAISIHVRRGDYVNDKHTNQVHGVCSLSYYYEAIELMNSKNSNPVFYIFSDDIEWAKKNLLFKKEKIFIDFNDKSNYEDMRLMSNCKHHIIANSSFSWWGAWLNNSKSKIVIAPKIWFNNSDWNNQTTDLIPPEWLRI